MFANKQLYIVNTRRSRPGESTYQPFVYNHMFERFIGIADKQVTNDMLSKIGSTVVIIVYYLVHQVPLI